MNQPRWVKYHTCQWMLLVELGMITHTIEIMPDGQRYAYMVPKDWKGGD